MRAESSRQASSTTDGKSAGEFRVVRATADDVEDAVRIIHEYQDAVGVVVRDSADEIASALTTSSSDDKVVWLAYAAGEPRRSAVGCIVLRKLSRAQGEVKRLYVQPAGRGRGVAQQLLQVAEAHAAAHGYGALYLDTKDDLQAAIRFYEAAGYTRCDRYNDNPQATIFMRKSLSPSPRGDEGALILRPYARGSTRDAEAFRVLNEAWITTLFELEEKDREVLNDPEGKIIARGGQIFMAECDDICIGCCALLAMEKGVFELAKMAVAESERGRGVGRQMLAWTVEQMRSQGARRLFLETNSKLRNAIHLYQQIGFRQLSAEARPLSPYVRADVAMLLEL